MADANNGESIVELRGVSKSYTRGKEDVHVLDNLDLTVKKGAFEAFMGPSGSGKSTLLNLIGGIDHASAGSVRVAGQELTRLGDGDLAKFRSATLGFIFQQYNLLPVLNALDNVELPLLLTGLGSGERKKRAQTALRVVGLEDRMTHFPRQLSGGQEQRVAIARAIVNDPQIIVADEPTGDLDRKSADDILTLLAKLNKEFGKTVLMVTHDPLAAERATIVHKLDKGEARVMTLIGLGARNAFRNRFRTALTVLGVAVAVLAFVLLRTVISSWNLATEVASKDRIATRHKLSFVISLPKRYLENIRQVNGVEATTYLTWFGGKDPNHPDSFFANMVCDPPSFLDVYDEIELPEEQKKHWLEDRQGAIIGKSLANQLGLKVGDRFTLQGTIYPGDWVLNIDGIYTASRKSIDQSSMFFHWNYMNESLPANRKDKIGWVMSRIDDPGRGAEVAAQIDKIFDQFDQQTLTMSERSLNLSFMGMFTAIIKAINVVSIVILLILVMILANTIAMGVRERTAEYGALRALGFMPSHIRLFILGESATLGILAGLLGLGLAVPLVQFGMSRFIEENMGGMFPYFRIDAGTVVTALVLSLVLGLLSGLVPAVQAGRQSVVNALRRVE